jgi:hypothetical protein
MLQPHVSVARHTAQRNAQTLGMLPTNTHCAHTCSSACWCAVRRGPGGNGSGRESPFNWCAAAAAAGFGGMPAVSPTTAVLLGDTDFMLVRQGRSYSLDRFEDAVAGAVMTAVAAAAAASACSAAAAGCGSPATDVAATPPACLPTAATCRWFTPRRA